MQRAKGENPDPVPARVRGCTLGHFPQVSQLVDRIEYLSTLEACAHAQVNYKQALERSMTSASINRQPHFQWQQSAQRTKENEQTLRRLR